MFFSRRGTPALDELFMVPHTNLEDPAFTSLDLFYPLDCNEYGSVRFRVRSFFLTLGGAA